MAYFGCCDFSTSEKNLHFGFGGHIRNPYPPSFDQDTYEPNDPEAIQKSFARHLEYSLACTRFNFTMQDGGP